MTSYFQRYLLRLGYFIIVCYIYSCMLPQSSRFTIYNGIKTVKHGQRSAFNIYYPISDRHYEAKLIIDITEYIIQDENFNRMVNYIGWQEEIVHDPTNIVRWYTRTKSARNDITFESKTNVTVEYEYDPIGILRVSVYNDNRTVTIINSILIVYE